MRLILAALPERLTHYDGKPVPAWMRLMHPSAAEALVALETKYGPLSYTDIWRSAEVSLHAQESKTGVQAPGFSGHNFGFSVDMDVDGCQKKAGIRYQRLLEIMAEFQFFCHRRDGSLGSEEWHFNHFPDPKYLARMDSKNHHTWSHGIEQRIVDIYGGQFILDVRSVQQSLAQLKLYSGPLDGEPSAILTQSIRAFQRAWKLSDDGVTGPMTQRTLAFVAANKIVVPLTVVPAAA